MNTGVYQIRNVINNKLYIGSAAGKGFRNRWQTHKLDLLKGCHHSSILQNAWNKYGADAFVFEILLYCDPQDCLTFEQTALDTISPAYNISPTAGSQLGYKHSEATKIKIRQAHVGKPTPSHRGDLHSMSKLGESEVREIRQMLKQGETQKKIAEHFEVDQSTISYIKTGKRWGWMR